VCYVKHLTKFSFSFKSSFIVLSQFFLSFLAFSIGVAELVYFLKEFNLRCMFSLQTASPRDLAEVSTKQKKSSGKGKPDSPKVEASADLPVPSSDEFIPALPKARGKKKPENSVPKPRYFVHTLVLCYS